MPAASLVTTALGDVLLSLVALAPAGGDVHADVRHLVHRLHPGEPWVVALRIHDGQGDADLRERQKPFQLDELKYEVFDPAGTQHVARFPSQKLARLRLRPLGDTVLLVAETDGVSLRLGEAPEKKPVVERSGWRGEDRVDLDLPGRWTLQFSGVLRFADSKDGPRKWVEGWYDVERLPASPAGVDPLDPAALREAAIAAVQTADPKARLQPAVLPCLEGGDGGRAVLLLGRPSRGVAPMFQVHLAPDLAVTRVTRHPVRHKPGARQYERALDDLWLRLWPDQPEVLFPAPAPDRDGGRRSP